MTNNLDNSENINKKESLALLKYCDISYMGEGKEEYNSYIMFKGLRAIVHALFWIGDILIEIRDRK